MKMEDGGLPVLVKLIDARSDLSIQVHPDDAYAAVHPAAPAMSLTDIVRRPVEEWQQLMVNDFEASVFSKYPEIAAIKDKMYDLGAIYASMSGSGSSVFGIFDDPVENVDEKFSGMFCRQREL
jgi:4-diphosphocytidyl-2-C-methyl-D-erythritol kinase